MMFPEVGFLSHFSPYIYTHSHTTLHSLPFPSILRSSIRNSSAQISPANWLGSDKNMVRAACLDKNGVKRGAWSEEEDHKLRTYVLKYGHWNWRLLPKYAGLNRCGKSCRLRWMNYLKPGVKRGDFTREEGELVRKLHNELGNRWSAIAAQLPGRTDNEVKNFWHTHFNKGRRSKTTTCKSVKQPQASSAEILYSGVLKLEGSEAEAVSSSSSEVYVLDTSSCSSSNSGVSEASANWDLDSLAGENWSEMLLRQPSDGLDFAWDDAASSSSDSFPGLIQESFVVDTSYIQEFDFPLFDESGIYFNDQSLGFDDEYLKLF